MAKKINWLLLATALYSCYSLAAENGNDYIAVPENKELNQSANTTTQFTQPLSTAQTAPILKSERQVNTKNAKEAKHDAAFNDLLSKLMPLNPEQILQMKKLYDVSKQAIATPAHNPPTPVSSSLTVNLSPGSPSPVIRLSEGFVSSLVFVDATGAPWPIVAYSIADSDSFDIQWDQVSNTMFLQSKKTYVHGNIAVRLKDLNTPVMLSFVSGQREIDYRIDLRIASRGPFASAPILPDSTKTSGANKTLLNLLDGIPPQESRKLIVSQDAGQAWLKGTRMYFRTNAVVLSPAWHATVSSADGTNVYEMAQTPTILISRDGKTISVELGGL